MIIAFISHDKWIQDEQNVITALLEDGLDYCHIRKPEAGVQQIKNFINTIHHKYHNKLIVHYHFELLKTFDLRGIHFSNNNKHMIDDFLKTDYHKSISVHSLKEAEEYKDKGFDYMFLSPVFDSISKSGYDSGFKPGEVKAFLSKNSVPLVALGGVDETRIKTVYDEGFSGIALYGALWKRFEKNSSVHDLIHYVDKIKDLCSIAHTY